MELIKSNQNLPVQMGQNLPLTDLGNKMVQLINSGKAHDFSRFKAEMSVEKAVKDGSLLQVLYKNQPEETLELVSYLIVDFANSINVGKNISDAQVDDIACVICTRFKDLKLEELVIVFSNAKAGLYGKMYDRLDIVIISEFISKYQAGEKADYLEKANHYSNFPGNSILDAIVNSEVPEDPHVQQTQKALQELVSGNKPIDRSKFTPTAVIPKDTDYLEKARQLIPAFNLKELQIFRRHALQANWPELIEMIDAEILTRIDSGERPAEKTKSNQNKHKRINTMPKNNPSQEISERKKFLEEKIAELSDKIKYTPMKKHEFEDCIDERKEYLMEYKNLDDSHTKPESKEAI